VIFESDPNALPRHAERAFEASLDEVLEAVQATAPRITGEYADSIIVIRADQGTRLVARVGSPLRRAAALERGAWVKNGRGPHMRKKGKLRITATKSFKAAFLGAAAQIPIEGISARRSRGARRVRV